LALQERHHAWDLPLPDEKAVSCTCATIKADGTFKARLVARGTSNRLGGWRDLVTGVQDVLVADTICGGSGEDLHCEQFDVIAAFPAVGGPGCPTVHASASRSPSGSAVVQSAASKSPTASGGAARMAHDAAEEAAGARLCGL
jgi:hypothetical protein